MSAIAQVDDGFLEVDDPSINSVLDSVQLPQMPEDCVFGDGGAQNLIDETDGDQSAVAPDPKRPKQTSSSSRSLPTGPFNSLLSGDRVFEIECGDGGISILKMHDSVTGDSKGIVASVYTDATLKTRLGTLSTAMPLSASDGLKAVCDTHKVRKEKPCQCWIRLKKSAGESEASDIFKVLAEWLGGAPNQSRQQHLDESEVLRQAAGMKIRKR